MLGEVVAAHEAPVTHGAHKFLLTGVCSSVTGELVGAGEALITTVPAATEGLLTCVCPKMSLEV